MDVSPRLSDTATVNHSQWAVQGSGTISTSWVQGCGALGALWIKCPEGRARLEAKYRALRMTTCRLLQHVRPRGRPPRLLQR